MEDESMVYILSFFVDNLIIWIWVVKLGNMLMVNLIFYKVMKLL